MNDETDALIRDAIRNEDQQLASVLQDEAPITEVIVQSFRGRRRWLSIIPFIESFIFLGLAIWFAYEFFGAETTKHQIAWAAGFMLAAVSIALCKIWIWGEWQRNSLAREIKRLELAIADLRKRMQG